MTKFNPLKPFFGTPKPNWISKPIPIMQAPLTLLSLLLLAQTSLAQTLINLAELNLKIPAANQHELYYTLAQGDQLSLNLHTQDDKTLAKFQVFAYPDELLYSELEVQELNNKIITIPKNGVYKILLKNTAPLKTRKLKIQIQRLPACPQTQAFNTAVQWLERPDTSYILKKQNVITHIDTLQHQEQIKVLSRVDTQFIEVFNRTERVSSLMKFGASNTTFIEFDLPQSQYQELETSELYAWSYAIHVGENGTRWYKDQNTLSLANASIKSLVQVGLLSSGVGVLGGVALGLYSAIANPPQGDNVLFEILDQNQQILASGNTTAAIGRVSSPNARHVQIKLKNDNVLDGINVQIQVMAVLIRKRYKFKEKKTIEKKHSQKQVVQQAQVKMLRYPSPYPQNFEPCSPNAIKPSQP